MKRFAIDNMSGYVLNLFAGKTELGFCEVRNDLDESMHAEYHKEALDFVVEWGGSLFDTVILDPPYSYRKSMELYKGNKNSRFKLLKDNLPGILRKSGCVITYGYHSISMGQKRGFEVVKIGIFHHGGAIHDTIATVEIFTG